MFEKTLKSLMALPFAAALAAAPAAGQSEDGEDPVVATVNDVELRVSDVVESARDLPAEYQTQIQLIFPQLVDRLVDFTLLDLAAQENDMADDEEVLERTEDLKREVMRDVLLERAISERVTEEALEDAYQNYLVENPPGPEVKARHILLETEEEAEEVIARLDEGGDFAELAKELSTGPTGPNGGDLGYFVEGQMVEPFSDAAFGLEPGNYTDEPVETQFGWHVILVEDKREQEPPTFEELENQLVEQVSRKAVQDFLAELREDAEVELRLEEAEAEAAPESGGDGAADEEGAAEEDGSGDEASEGDGSQ